MQQPDNPIHRYHDGTKHHFNRYARSLGYLDWATQPRPFRSFAGTHSYLLYPAPGAHDDGYVPVAVEYDQLFQPSGPRTRVSASAVGDLLRHSLGLSAWKVFGSAKWSLRVNPSSGNLHPTEAYVVCGPLAGLSDEASVYHYAPDRHVLEQRCRFERRAWDDACEGRETLLIALTSIHWRESWKYGERAFRYCQHDLGHAIAAVSLAAGMLGWRAELVPTWSHRMVATLTGIDRDQDFLDAEREEPGCVLLVSADRRPPRFEDGDGRLLRAIESGQWTGRASQLSEDHVQWTFIDEAAHATEDAGHRMPDRPALPVDETRDRRAAPSADGRLLTLQRRSAVAFDGQSSIDADTFFAMLARTLPGEWLSRVVWWTPRIHFVVFVHRVANLAPGLYLFGRDAGGFDRLQREVRGHDLREPAHPSLPLICIGPGDCRGLARRLSCDQDIAADGCFSLGMIAEFDASLAEYGQAFYRQLFWESGAVGQMLYLEAEAAGVRATGIGCFYDDPVHELLGLQNHAFQSLYHFTVGVPVEDRRLTTEPGYVWG